MLNGIMSAASLLLFVLAPLLAVPAAALAQSAALAGTVRDDTGGVLPGATITASSAVLIQGSRTAISDGSGQYRITELPPGVYDVSVTLPGFAVARRDGVELTSGVTTVVHAALPVGDLTETVTVSAAAAAADVQNVRQQTVFRRDAIDALPSGRTYGNLGALIPGVTLSTVSTGTTVQDVGGSSGVSIPQRLAIHGGRATDQSVMVNGMSVTNLEGDSVSLINFSDANLQEMVLGIGAHSAEVENGGVIVNLVVRDGSSVFAGRAFGNFTNSRFQDDNYSDALRARGLRAPNRVKRMWNVAGSLGGPLHRDRLWFSAAAASIRTENFIAGMFTNTTPAAWTPTFDLSRQAFDDQKTGDANLRLTWRASARSTLTAYYQYNEACLCHFAVSATRTPEASLIERRPNQLAQATWTMPATGRLLIEAGGSFSVQRIHRAAQPESTEPAIRDVATGLGYRGISTLAHEAYVHLRQEVDNLNGRASLAYVTGRHAFKAGVTLLAARDRILGAGNNGDVSYAVLDGRPIQVTYWALPYLIDFHNRPRLGVFAQDQWTLRRVTINAGLRYDYLASGYADQPQPAGQFVPHPRQVPGAQVVGWSDLNPRLGLAWDLRGDGRTALKASLSRYVLQPDVPPGRALDPVLTSLTNPRAWTDRNGDFEVQGDPRDPAANGELGPSTNLAFGTPTPAARYDPAWAYGFRRRPANWEASGGVQHAVREGLLLGAAWFHRRYVNFDVTDNLAIGPADFDPYCVTAPLDARLPGGGGYGICGLYDLAPAQVGQVDLLRTSAAVFGEQSEHWNGVDLTVNARLPRGTLLQGGVSSGRTVSDTCDVVARVDNPSPLYCRVETPWLTQAKLAGSVTLPGGVQVAGAFQSLPGPAVAAQAVFTSAQIAPSLGRPLSSAATATVNLVAPGTMYGQRLQQLDLRVAKVLAARRTRVTLMVDVFNALNGAAVQSVNTTYGQDGAAWLTPTFVLSARLVKVGAQLTF